MWFECSECGGHVLGSSAPEVCPECGVAGAIFLPADPEDLVGGCSDGDGLRATWLRAGFEQLDLVADA
ncbi:MAG TPA: hypothetical protein VHO06_15580 [Polyangia bacterium]|nr:hypothetical protein [Polyangia bacterium]